jgi:hypothetical protein
MARNDSIFELVDNLPEKSLTTRVLHALDFVAPGEWTNLVGFENTIRAVTGETDEQMIQKIGERAIVLYNDKKQGYQRAMWLYRSVDRVDKNLATVALANTVGGQVRWLNFLERITPKDDKVQGLDLSLKLAAELAAFCLINGIPGDSIGDFVKALGEYSNDSMMRMAALTSLDGVLPFGADFLDRVTTMLDDTGPDEMKQNDLYQNVAEYLPGANAQEKTHLIKSNFQAVRGWMGDLVARSHLTQDKVVESLSSVVDVTDRKLDYLAALVDMTTNYYEHTGTQTLARRLIQRAVNEI